MKADVSAIVPTYNYGRFLPEAIKSALDQTYPVLEIIVVDDGSTDNTREIMQGFTDNPRIRYVPKKNGGPASARNEGIRQARGDYIGFLDADDEWHPQKIEWQVDFLNGHSEVGMVGTGWSSEAAPLPSAQPSIPNEEYTIQDFLEFAPLHPSSVMIRRTAFEQVGLFDENLKYCEDLDFWIRVAAQFRVARLLPLLTVAREHPSAQSMRVGENFRYHQMVMDKLFSTIPQLQAHPRWRRIADAREYTYKSWRNYCAGMRLLAVWDILQSICHWPLALRSSRQDKQRCGRLKRIVRYSLFPPPEPGRGR